MAEKYPDSGPESSAPSTSSQSGDQQVQQPTTAKQQQNVGNSQIDSRSQEIMSGTTKTQTIVPMPPPEPQEGKQKCGSPEPQEGKQKCGSNSRVDQEVGKPGGTNVVGTCDEYKGKEDKATPAASEEQKQSQLLDDALRIMEKEVTTRKEADFILRHVLGLLAKQCNKILDKTDLTSDGVLRDGFRMWEERKGSKEATVKNLVSALLKHGCRMMAEKIDAELKLNLKLEREEDKIDEFDDVIKICERRLVIDDRLVEFFRSQLELGDKVTKDKKTLIREGLLKWQARNGKSATAEKLIQHFIDASMQNEADEIREEVKCRNSGAVGGNSTFEPAENVSKGPESSAPSTSLQSGDQQVQQPLENVGNSQIGSRSQDIMSGKFETHFPSNNPQSNPEAWKRPQISTDISKEQKPSVGDDLTQVGGDVYIYKLRPLRKEHHIYRGVQKQLGGVVSTDLAVKIFHIDKRDKKLYKWYLSEVKKMSEFNHSNIVRFIQCGKVLDNKLGGFYIAMELCHQLTLADVNVTSLRRDQKQNLFLQICDGVEYLHRNEVAHMDLKTGNIQFSLDRERAVVSDFGLSKYVDKEVKDGKTYITRSSSRYGGTQGWISMEMIRRNTGETKSTEQQDTEPDYYKADIFSLGLVGHHVFYGCHPFRKIDHPKLQSYWEVNINDGKSPSIGPQEPGSAEPDIADLFKKMLSHDPEQRPVIRKVLQHWMFWSPTKKINFLTNMYNHYLGNGEFRTGVMENGTEEQKLAYEKLPDTSDANVPAFGTCSGQGHLSLQSVSISPTQSSSNSEKQEDGGEPGRKRIIMKMREIMGDGGSDHWMNKIKEITKKKNESEGVANSKKSEQENSLCNLVRLIRNKITHALGAREDAKYVAQKWMAAFPKLWPYLFEILEPAFKKEDKKEYKCRSESSSGISVKPLLEIEEIKAEFAQRVKPQVSDSKSDNGLYTLFNDVYIQRKTAYVLSTTCLDLNSRAAIHDIVRSRDYESFPTEPLQIRGKSNQKVAVELDITEPHKINFKKEFHIQEVLKSRSHHILFDPELQLEDYGRHVTLASLVKAKYLVLVKDKEEDAAIHVCK